MNVLTNTKPSYSNELVFNIIEQIVLAFQKKDADSMLKHFAETIEFRAGKHPTEPIMGIDDFKSMIEANIKEAESFDFKIKSVLWDEGLKMGSTTIEYEIIDTAQKGQRIYENFVFALDGILITYVISTYAILHEW